jgi:transcriptional regulator with XRE-family HTH domain
MHLREWRIKHEKNQEWLAEQLGVTQGYVSELERGDKIPSDDVAAKIEEVTCGSVTFLELKHPKYRAANGN